jgi:hypothetical protein
VLAAPVATPPTPAEPVPAATPLSPRLPPRTGAGAAAPTRVPARMAGAVAPLATPVAVSAPADAVAAPTPLSPRVAIRTPQRVAAAAPVAAPARIAAPARVAAPPAVLSAKPPSIPADLAPPVPSELSPSTPDLAAVNSGSLPRTLRSGANLYGGGRDNSAAKVSPPQSQASTGEYVSVPAEAAARPLPVMHQESSYGVVPPAPQAQYGLTSMAKKPSNTAVANTPVLSAVPLPKQVVAVAQVDAMRGSNEYVKMEPIMAVQSDYFTIGGEGDGDDDGDGDGDDGDMDGDIEEASSPPPADYDWAEPQAKSSEYVKVEPLPPASDYAKVDFSDSAASTQEKLSASSASPALGTAPASTMSEPSLMTPGKQQSLKYTQRNVGGSVSHAVLSNDGGLMKEARVPLSQTARQSRYAPLLQVLSGSSLLFVNALAVAAAGADEEPLLTALCCGLDAHGMLRDAIISGIAAEVASCPDATTLFRANNGTTKLVGAFTKLVGQQYLSALIKPYIAEISTTKATCEVDASKLNREDYEGVEWNEADIVADNIEQLKHWTTRLLTKVAASLGDVPPALKWLASALRLGVQRKFPASGGVSVAGFYFLRFVCPALVAPVARGVTDKAPPPRIANVLKYVSKMMQAMANGVTFKKEAAMLPLNDFVRDKSTLVTDICATLSGDGATAAAPLASIGDAESIHLRYVYLFMCQSREKVEKSLLSYKQDEVIALIPDIIEAVGVSQNTKLTPLRDKLQVDEVLSRKESNVEAVEAAPKQRGRKLERRTGRNALAMMSGAVKCQVCGERPFESRLTRDGKTVLACNACEAALNK